MSVPVLVSPSPPSTDASPEPSDGRTLLVPVPTGARSRETPPDVGEMYSRLSDQVQGLAESGDAPPCLGSDGYAWTSDEPADQEYAADRCWDCPLVFQCRAYAVAAGETAGVWGGHTPDLDCRARRRPSPESRERAKARRRLRNAQSKAQVRGNNCEGGIPPVFLGSEGEKQLSPTQIGYPTMNTKAPKNGTCNCGCGEATGPKAMYRPGHDARHVSSLIGYLENDQADGKKITAREIASLAKQLPSVPLQAKFTRAAERFAAKVAAAPKQAPKGGEAA